MHRRITMTTLALVMALTSILSALLDASQPIYAAGGAAAPSVAGMALSFMPPSAEVADTAEAADLALGLGHTCRVTTDKEVECWGLNRKWQLGNGTPDNKYPADSLNPVIVTGLTNVVAVTAGYEHTCALRANGEVWCWGDGVFGQLGNGDVKMSSMPVQVQNLGTATAITSGVLHTCALLADGTVRCWGYNAVGQLGDTTTTQRTTAVAVTDLTDVASIAAKGDHTCALLKNATVVCWGNNSSGELGDGSFVNQVAPVPVSGLTNVAAIALGNRHTCALLADKTLRCWGYNYSGQIGDGTQANRNLPTEVVNITNAAGVVAGGYFTCALLTDATVRCWGNNTYSELGSTTGPISLTPQPPVAGLSGVAKLAAGNAHACAQLLSGDLLCWGWNGFGQLGNRTKTDQISPVAISGLTGVRGVAAGRQHACVLLASGVVECWGLNGNGQVGDGLAYDRITPTPVTELTNATAVTAGYYHTCALLADGTVKCWGSNGSGQLGNGTRSLSAVPVVVSGLIGVTALSAGGNHTCALRSDGHMFCWGANEQGQVGNGTTTDQLTPVEVQSSIESIGVGDLHTCAVLTGGSAKCWGFNSYGQLGDGTTQNRTFPTAVQNVTNIGAIAPGALHTCVRFVSGGVSCWGDNTWGELGDGTGISRFTPASISGISNVVALDSSARHTCAVQQDGTAICWGDNRYGQLGDSSTTIRFAPVKAAAPAKAVSVSSSDEFTCYVLAGEGGACTGSNAYGQMGRGQAPSKPAPGNVDTPSLLSVVDGTGAPLAGAEVWIYRSGQRINPTPAVSDALGRAVVPELLADDRVVALLPVPGGVRQGWPYRLYITSLDDGAAHVVAADGEQPVLVVKKTSPLFLFDLVVSLEWCDVLKLPVDMPQQQYVRNGLTVASRYLYDVTDGQFAFGKIDIYDCAEHWQDADVQILTSSYVRPWANTGGIVPAPLAVANKANVPLKFAPGHLRMGRTWTRDGSVNFTQLDKIWFDQPDAVRAFTHEFLHYAGFLFDQYFDSETGDLQPAACVDVHTAQPEDSYWLDGSASVMYWPYGTSELDQEGSLAWAPACELTEQYHVQNESSWDTLARMYSDSQDSPRWVITTPRDRIDRLPLVGPEQDQPFPDLPLLSAPANRTGNSTESVTVRDGYGTLVAGSQAQAFLIRQTGDGSGIRIFDQGSPNALGALLIPGYKRGDVTVALSWDGLSSALSPSLSATNLLLTLRKTQAGTQVWSPRVTAQPVATGGSMTGLSVQVCGTDVGSSIYAMVVPVGGEASGGVRLNATKRSSPETCYGGTFEMSSSPIPEGLLWVCAQDSQHDSCDPLRDRFTVFPYALGDGSPGSHGRSYVPSSSNGYCSVHLQDGALDADAPVLFMATRGGGMPLPRDYKYVSAPCYVGLPDNVHLARPVPLLLYYNETELWNVSGDSLEVLRWDDAGGWQQVKASGQPDRYTYFTSLLIKEPGTYVVVAKLQSELPGFNSNGPDVTGVGTVPAANVVQLGRDILVGDAFPPACQLKSLTAFDAATDGSVLRNIPGAPEYVNNLQKIEAGKIYYAQVGADCNGGQSGSGAATDARTFPASLLPATFYGKVRTPAGKPAAPGTLVAAQVDGRTWGETRTFSFGADTVFVISVAGDDPLLPALQGAQPGNEVRFLVDGVDAQVTAVWQPAIAAAVDLQANALTYKAYLPAIQR